VFRGGATEGELLYLGQGNKFLEVNNGFAVTDRNAASRFTTNNGRMAMTSSETVIVMADGTNAYNYTVATLAFAQIASAMFASPKTVTWQDGYFLASFDETGTNKKRCQISADGITWNALDYRAVESTPGAADPHLRLQRRGAPVHRQGHRVLVLHRRPDFPVPAGARRDAEVGLAARWSVAEGDQCLYFLGRKSSSKGQVAVYELSGHQARSITTPDIANLINAYGTKSDAVGYTVSIDEHTFYVLSFPTAGKTWVYDAYASGLLGVPVWSELSSANGRHYSDLGFTLVDVPYVSDYGDGQSLSRRPDRLHRQRRTDRVGIGHAALLQGLRPRDGRRAGDGLRDRRRQCGCARR
jgi:hypothetical protein